MSCDVFKSYHFETKYAGQGEYNSARSKHVYSAEENMPAKVKETIKKISPAIHSSARKILCNLEILYVWFKKSTMKFFLNAYLDTLPTKLTFYNGGKRPQAYAGRRKENAHHILNGCKVSLNQQRYTWLRQYSKIHMWKCWQLNADIYGYSLLGGGTISPDLCVTPERPDIIIHDISTNRLLIFELTVPLETNILNDHTRKARKYSHFFPDITSAKFKIPRIHISRQQD